MHWFGGEVHAKPNRVSGSYAAAAAAAAAANARMISIGRSELLLKVSFQCGHKNNGAINIQRYLYIIIMAMVRLTPTVQL
jgi:hypothetical protein